MENIFLQKILPDFLEKEKIEQSEIWNNTITVAKGQKLQIVSPSGSGKTSLIHFLYGLRKDFKGTINFDDKNISEFSAEGLAEYRSKYISIIFQDLRLFPDHSAKENIEIKRLLQPLYPSENIREMAEHLGIASKLDQHARTCSYGEQQRIAIIRSLQQPFDFLLMDEPFSHLDESNRQKAMELIEKEAAKRNAAIILADLEPRAYFKADSILHL
ncbi:MAG: ATP-binding cassette domain-containing protein [Ferruginibacter sp.]